MTSTFPFEFPATFRRPPSDPDIGSFSAPDYGSSWFKDRLRFSIVQVNTNEVLTRDLVVKEPEVSVQLSAPSRCSFKIDQGQNSPGQSSYGIDWKNWGQWIIPEIETHIGKFCLGAQLVTGNHIDPQSGDLIIDATGFLGYPKGIPWLENFNPIAVDPAEVIQRIWAHLQSFVHANLGVDVQPSSTGTQMLPGYGFDGSILSFDFFAMFIRAIDFPDAGDQILALARDLPLDLFEEVSWNEDRTEVLKTVRIAYPLGGAIQNGLVFRLGENMINAELAEELEIEPVSDVIIRSWIPGKTYSATLSNADMERARRVILEEDAGISSSERAAAWAKRKLTRRNIPTSFSKITIDPEHSHAPFGTWWVGDSIFIDAPDFPWHGTIKQWHRITSFTIKGEEPLIELGVKVEGAFNYDPIIYDPNYDQEPTVDPNLLSNGYFLKNLSGWRSIRGQWIRLSSYGYGSDGCVRIDCDDNGEELRSNKISVNPGETINIQGAVRWQDILFDHPSEPPEWGFGLVVNSYDNSGIIGIPGPSVIVDSVTQDGAGPYTPMSADFVVPMTGVTDISISLKVHPEVDTGIAFWDDIKVLRPEVEE